MTRTLVLPLLVLLLLLSGCASIPSAQDAEALSNTVREAEKTGAYLVYLRQKISEVTPPQFRVDRISLADRARGSYQRIYDDVAGTAGRARTLDGFAGLMRRPERQEVVKPLRSFSNTIISEYEVMSRAVQQLNTDLAADARNAKGTPLMEIGLLLLAALTDYVKELPQRQWDDAVKERLMVAEALESITMKRYEDLSPAEPTAPSAGRP